MGGCRRNQFIIVVIIIVSVPGMRFTDSSLQMKQQFDGEELLAEHKYFGHYVPSCTIKAKGCGQRKKRKDL